MTLWMVGLMLLILSVGGISVDLWRAHAELRALNAAADAAAFAGASGLDTAAFRRDGTLQLDPSVARRLAHADLSAQPVARRAHATLIDASTAEVRVTLEGSVDLALLGLLAPQHDPLPVRVTAVAEPRVVP